MKNQKRERHFMPIFSLHLKILASPSQVTFVFNPFSCTEYLVYMFGTFYYHVDLSQSNCHSALINIVLRH